MSDFDLVKNQCKEKFHCFFSTEIAGNILSKPVKKKETAIRSNE